MWKNNISNLALRTSALVAKFLLLIYMTKYIGLEAVGIFGLLMGMSLLGSNVMGMGLSFVANRELTGAVPERQTHIARNQIIVYICAYIVAGILFIIAEPLVPEAIREYYLHLYIVMLLGNMVTEMSKQLISLHRSTNANVLVSLSNGLWAYIIIALGFINEEFRTLDIVITAWVIATFISFFLGQFWLRKMIWTKEIKWQLDLTWIKSSLRKGFSVYLVSFGMVWGIYIDRYIVGWQQGLEIAGVFVMFWSFGNAIQQMIQAGLLQTTYPKLIQHHKNGNEEEFWKISKTLVRNVALVGVVFCLLAAILIHPILQFADKEPLIRHTQVFYILLIGFWVAMISEVAYYVLYSRHQDKVLVISSLAQFSASLIMNIIFVSILGLIGAAIAMVITFMTVLLIRWRYIRGELKAS